MYNFFVTFLIVFIIVYLLYLFVFVLNKKKKNGIFETNQAKLIIVPNKLNTDMINRNCFAHVLALANSFIVSFTFALSEFFDNYIVKLLFCFIILFVLIFIIYRLIGFIYKKKEGR